MKRKRRYRINWERFWDLISFPALFAACYIWYLVLYGFGFGG